MFCFGALIAGGIYAGLNVYGSKLREEHEKLKTAIQDQEATLAKIQEKTWGLSLHEDKNGRFIVLPEGMTSEATWTVGKRTAIRLVK